jgi:hypothetical protein
LGIGLCRPEFLALNRLFSGILSLFAIFASGCKYTIVFARKTSLFVRTRVIWSEHRTGDDANLFYARMKKPSAREEKRRPWASVPGAWIVNGLRTAADTSGSRSTRRPVVADAAQNTPCNNPVLALGA